MKKHLLLLLVFVSFLGLNEVFAQGATTSGINGTITDGKGETLPGATVLAVHTPSGSRYGVSTQVDGRFIIQGMRTGGPYTVTISFVGYKEQKIENVYLTLGSSQDLSVKLQEANVELETVEIVSERSNLIGSDRTGASTNVGKDALSAMPTLSRSLTDFTRLTPQANGRGFGGQDARFNNITIDGSIFNNSFGLSDLPGGQTNSSPISLDAIEEIQINLAPYDVRQGGFVGAGVNAITRSGTNEFSGSFFYNARNQSFLGTKSKGESVAISNFNVSQMGFRLGGPIIKNKLFFFINGENETRTDPGTTFLANRGSSGANVTRVLASELDQLRSFLTQNFGYDPGSYESYNLETYSNKLLARLDYNISDNHKFSVRYNYLRSYRDVPTSTSGSPRGNRSGNVNALPFSNTNYVINNDIHSVVGELNSTFGGGKFSNNLMVSFTANRDYRSSRGGIFPLVDIIKENATYTSFGYEPFTPNNRLDTDTWQIQNNFTYYAGKHVFTAGFNIDAFEFRNTFTPTYYGQYVFNSLDDFYAAANQFKTNPNAAQSDVAMFRYNLTYSALPGAALPTATTNVIYWGLYAQDEIQVNSRFKVTAGLRFDVPMFQQTALENKQVTDAVFKNADGSPLKLNTGKLPNTAILWSPRVGFNLDVMGDKTTQLRGGTGLFSGRPAFVWLSNHVGNNGVLTGAISQDNTRNYPFSPNPNRHIPSNPTTPASFNIAPAVEDFKFPQVWRSNIAIDQKLPWWGLVATAEFIYSKTVNGVMYINANLEPSTQRFSGVDTRPRFPGYGLAGTALNNANRVVDNITDAPTLLNTDQGYSYSFTAKLEKPMDKGFSAMAAYNFGVSTDLIQGGSIAFSSWRDNVSVMGNNLPDLAFSDNDQRHRIIGAISYRKEWAKWAATQVSLFFESRNIGRFSYVYSGDMNGDQQTANDLIFVPNKATDLIFLANTVTLADGVTRRTYTPEEQSAALESYISQDEYLSSRRGQYAERNGVIMPWVTRADFSIVQDFFVKVGGKRNTIQLRADIFNVGNLINQNWGNSVSINTRTPLIPAGVNAQGVPQFRMQAISGLLPTSTYRTGTGIGDVWQAQLGVRYIFN